MLASLFLSTLSLRRATGPIDTGRRVKVISIHALLAESDYLDAGKPRDVCYFYPRSPCGERRNGSLQTRQHDAISIHALLAESDVKFSISGSVINISIHALLAESDLQTEFFAQS